EANVPRPNCSTNCATTLCGLRGVDRGVLRETALRLGDERRQLALAPVQSPLALVQRLFPLLDLLEPEVRFQLVERRAQVGIGRQVAVGNRRAISSRPLRAACGTSDQLLLELRK